MDYRIEKTGSAGSVTTYSVTYRGIEAEGMEILLPESDLLILIVRCKSGLLLCRLFDPGVAGRIGTAAAVFSAADLPQLLEGKPVALSAPAEEKGAHTGMTGLELLELFS